MSQEDEILDHLEKGFSLTPLEALEKFGCLRLGARIHDLRNKRGVEIDTDTVVTPSGARVANYYLADVGVDDTSDGDIPDGLAS